MLPFQTQINTINAVRYAMVAHALPLTTTPLGVVGRY